MTFRMPNVPLVPSAVVPDERSLGVAEHFM